MTRSLPEWHGRTPDTPVPTRVRLRILARQHHKCADCKRAFDAKLKPFFDHRPALINGGQNRESMIFARCEGCHAPLTKADVKEKAKVDRLIKKIRYSLKPKSCRPIPKRHDPWGKEWRKRMEQRND